MTRPMQALIKNIRARLFANWGFGVIFFEQSNQAPNVFVASGCDRAEFVEICERFARNAKQGRKG